jgi:hypothetical protein
MDEIDKLIAEIDNQIQDADNAALRAQEKGLSLGQFDLQSEASKVRAERIAAEEPPKPEMNPPGYQPTGDPEKDVRNKEYFRKKYERDLRYMNEVVDPSKLDAGDLTQSTTVFDPDTGRTIGTVNRNVGVPGETLNVEGAGAPPRIERYDVDGQTRFAGSESPEVAE